MSWCARLAATLLVGCFGYALAGATLALLGASDAKAALACQTVADNCTQGAAYAAAQNGSANCATIASMPVFVSQTSITDNTVSKTITARDKCRNSAGNISDTWQFNFKYVGLCAGTQYTGSGPWASYVGQARSGSVGCRSGCDGAWFGNTDGTMTWQATGALCPLDPKTTCQNMASSGYHWNAVLQLCEPPVADCPQGKVADGNGGCRDDACPPGMVMQAGGSCFPEKNECPPGEVKSPAGSCLPGDGQCAQGEARGDDGTCKKDADGDGEPDEDDPDHKSFSGGDNCDSPPSCSGDPIMCGQARIQWRIDCNTRRYVNIEGGTCGAMPVCTGKNCDALEYSQLLMQWRTACALEKGIGGGGSTPDPNTAAIKDALTGNAGSPDIGEEGTPDGAFSDESGYGEGGFPGTGELDTSGFGYGRTCPTIPDVAVFGQTLHFDTSAFCQWLVLGGQIVLVMASLLSLKIISASGGDG